MKIQGKLKAKLQSETGQGQKGQWFKQNFMFESLDKYPKDFAVQAWNDLQATMDKIPLGTVLEMDVTIESREYNGKYYTDVKASAIAFLSAAPVQEQPITPHTGIPQNDNDDLPY
jgi:Domain of unknown function (DUF3127)